MLLVIQDETLSAELIAPRRASGQDKYDEIWDGVYVVAPMADNEHQDVVNAFSTSLTIAWDMQGLGRTQPGANVSNDAMDWRRDFRIPDVLCFTDHCQAVGHGSHWLGGPEFAVEITSPGNRTLEKLDFYAGVGTRELLIVDRSTRRPVDPSPWRLMLYRADTDGQSMSASAVCDQSHPDWVVSDIVPVQFQLGFTANQLRIAHADGRSLREVPFSH